MMLQLSSADRQGAHGVCALRALVTYVIRLHVNVLTVGTKRRSSIFCWHEWDQKIKDQCLALLVHLIAIKENA